MLILSLIIKEEMKKTRYRLRIYSKLWKGNVVDKHIWSASKFALGLKAPEEVPNIVWQTHKLEHLSLFITKMV